MKWWCKNPSYTSTNYSNIEQHSGNHKHQRPKPLIITVVFGDPELCVSAAMTKQQLAPRNFWSRAKDQWGMVKSWQLTGANDETLRPKSGQYQGTNKVLCWSLDLSPITDIINQRLYPVTYMTLGTASADRHQDRKETVSDVWWMDFFFLYLDPIRLNFILTWIGRNYFKKTIKTQHELRNDLIKAPEQTIFTATDTNSQSNTPSLWPMSHSGLQYSRRHGLTRTVSTPNSLSASAWPRHSQLSKWQDI